MTQKPKGRFKMPSQLNINLAVKNSSQQVVLINRYKIDARGVREGPNPYWNIEMVQLLDKGVILELPSDIGEQGATLGLTFKVIQENENWAIVAEAKITRIHMRSLQDQRMSFELEFTRIDYAAWLKFKDIVDGRANAATRIFSALKDYY